MDYINNIRNLVGSEKIFLNFSSVWIENERGILLEKRTDNSQWGLIGGAMELGESAQEAAKREGFEETGLQVEIKDLIGVYTKYERVLSNGDTFQPILFCFYGSIVGSQVLRASDESLELAFFCRENFPELGLDQHRDAARDALMGLSGIVR